MKEKVLKIVRSVADWFTRKWGLITTGAIGAAFALTAVFFFAYPQYISAHPGMFEDQDYHSLRTNVLLNGVEEEAMAYGLYRRSETVKTVKDESSGVKLSMSPYESSADFFYFCFMVPWELHGEQYQLGVGVYFDLLSATQETSNPFGIEVELLDENGETLIDPFLEMTANVHGTYSLSAEGALEEEMASNRHGYIDEDDWPSCVSAMGNAAARGASQFESFPGYFGHPNGKAFVSQAAYTYHAVWRGLSLSKGAIVASAVAVAFASVFFGCLIINASRRKKEQGAPVLFDEARPEPSQDASTITLTPSDQRMEAFLQRHKLRPIFGEWFFRGIGLFLVAASTVILSLIVEADFRQWGEGWKSFGEATWDLFTNISSVGSFILVIIIIGIISETHRRLNISSWAFLTLAAGYYFVSCAMSFSYEISAGVYGSRLANASARASPGNIFLGIGLFTIIGFFLFYNPSERFINRKVFRALSLIPLAIAITSIVFTYLYSAQDFLPSYWVSSIFFIRDSSILFMGIFYEFCVFFFRVAMKRRYREENVDALMERPFVQFRKNTALCLVIIFLTILFYVIPAEVRSNFGITATQAFYFVLIPFFLFYRPSGKNYKARSSAIYYVLYAIAWILPSIPDIIWVLSGNSL